MFLSSEPLRVLLVAVDAFALSVAHDLGELLLLLPLLLLLLLMLPCIRTQLQPLASDLIQVSACKIQLSEASPKLHVCTVLTGTVPRDDRDLESLGLLASYIIPTPVESSRNY